MYLLRMKSDVSHIEKRPQVDVFEDLGDKVLTCMLA